MCTDAITVRRYFDDMAYYLEWHFVLYAVSPIQRGNNDLTKCRQTQLTEYVLAWMFKRG